MSALGWITIGFGALFFAMGWPADVLACRPTARAGLGWGGLTFGLPAVSWLLVGWVYSETGRLDSDLGGAPMWIGWGTSVGCCVVGTLIARRIRSARS